MTHRSRVTEVISYLHSIGVSHNNLRPENMSSDKENGIKVVGLDMTSIYWDSDLEQGITKNNISSRQERHRESESHAVRSLLMRHF